MSKMISKNVNPLLSHSFPIGEKVNVFYQAILQWKACKKEVFLPLHFMAAKNKDFSGWSCGKLW
jgi:hypothetical protein